MLVGSPFHLVGMGNGSTIAAGNTLNHISASCQYALSSHLIDTPYHHILSMHLINTPYQYILSSHAIITSYQHIIPTHIIKTSNQPTLSTSPFNPPSHHPTQSSYLITVRPAFLQRYGRHPSYAHSLRSFVSVNGYLAPDPQLRAILHSAASLFDSTPPSRPDIPFAFWTRFMFSEGNPFCRSSPLLTPPPLIPSPSF